MWWFVKFLKPPQDEFASSNLVLHTFDTNGLASHQKRKKIKKKNFVRKPRRNALKEKSRTQLEAGTCLQ